MIPVRETDEGFEPIIGNPVLLSLDGEEKAPLAVLLHESWSDQDRARFGVYLVEPFVTPEGKQIDGQPAYERQDDKVVQVIPVKEVPVEIERTRAQKFDAMLARFDLTDADFIAELEARQK